MKNTTMITESIISFVFESEWISVIFILEKRRILDDSRISENDSNQIRSNRSIYKNERRAHFEIWVSKIHEIAKNRHKTICFVYVISKW
jgi:hypothetical protein